MDYTVRFSFNIFQDVVPLARVAETMAKRKAVGSGAIPWHKDTFLAMKQQYQDLLLDAATKGGLLVCNQFGRGGTIREIVDADPIGKQNPDLPEIYSLHVKAHHLSQWAATNGDTFRLEDTGIQVIKLNDGYGCLELPQAQTAATPAPLVVAGDEPTPLNIAPAWSLKTSLERTPGYRWPLYQFLKAAHAAGKLPPKAQDVLDAWKSNPPPGLSVIQAGRSDVLEYQLNHGAKKCAELKAIQSAIAGLIV